MNNCIGPLPLSVRKKKRTSLDCTEDLLTHRPNAVLSAQAPTVSHGTRPFRPALLPIRALQQLRPQHAPHPSANTERQAQYPRNIIQTARFFSNGRAFISPHGPPTKQLLHQPVSICLHPAAARPGPRSAACTKIKPISPATNFTRCSSRSRRIRTSRTSPSVSICIQPILIPAPVPRRARNIKPVSLVINIARRSSRYLRMPHLPPRQRCLTGAFAQSAPPFPSGHKKRSDLVGRPRLNVCFTARKALPSKPLLSRRGLGWLSASVGGVPPIQGQTPKIAAGARWPPRSLLGTKKGQTLRV